MAIFGKLARYQDIGLLVMRIGLGAMMILHGYDKLLGGPDKWHELGEAMGKLNIHFWPTFWGFMCGFAETFGGLFCILGLWFRPFCILLFFNFIVATAQHYSGIRSVPEASHAIELMCAFFGLIFIGPGVYSVDKG